MGFKSLLVSKLYPIWQIAARGRPLAVIETTQYSNPMSNQRTLVVVGLGYVGLPLAVLAREKGWFVKGYDTDTEKVARINAAEAPFVDEALSTALRKYPIEASTDPAVVTDASVIVVAVPTPVTDNNLPDLSPLISALTAIRPYLAAGQVLSIESTINPGVMNEVVLPLLRERKGLLLDADSTQPALYLCHCPERVNPGDPTWTVRNIPRVLGGYSSAGTQAAGAFYESVLEAPVKIMNSVTEAEAVKIMENTFRDVNIAFINEMAKSFAVLNIDIMNVIAGASTKPFAFLPHYPGNGVGGHCISVDPYYMIERARQAGFDHEFLKLARRINDSMPEYTVELLEKAMAVLPQADRQGPVALLGLAYKKDIGDLRESPALEIRQLLEDRGVTLRVYDPYVPERSTVDSLQVALTNASAVMLATNHTEFTQALTPEALKAAGVQVVIDGKNALDADGIAAQGISYVGIGRARTSAA